MPVPTVSFNPVEASLRVDLTPSFGVGFDFPKDKKFGSSFSIFKKGVELSCEDLSHQEFMALVSQALR